MKAQEVLLNKIQTSKLLDLYKEMLTQKQAQILEMYINDDFSISEISDNLSISRQAVFDSIEKAQKNMETYEEKLKLLEKSQTNLKNINQIKKELEKEKIDKQKIQTLINKLVI